MQAKYEISHIISIKMSAEDADRVFLPKHFTLVFSEVGMDMINIAMIKINVVYLGSPMLICFL